MYGEVSPCTDPLLVKGRRYILSFYRRMLRLGLAQATLRPVERVGIFTLWKKGRTTLRVFLVRGPPPSALLTAEGLANIGLDFGDYNDAPRNVNLSMSVGDLQDFHCLKIDERYGRLFPVCACEVSLCGTVADKVTLGGDYVKHLCAAALPVGQSWSLSFRHRVMEHCA